MIASISGQVIISASPPGTNHQGEQDAGAQVFALSPWTHVYTAVIQHRSGSVSPNPK